MNTTRAIETSYAGHRFRSRLEARWAVFFDHLNIKWQFEPQGYVIDGRPYLPDFWLPEIKLWVEVKGSMGLTDFRTVLCAAAFGGLPDGPDATCVPEVFRDTYQDRILLLGPIPPIEPAPIHVRLDMVNDLVFASGAVWTQIERHGKPGPFKPFQLGSPRSTAMWFSTRAEQKVGPVPITYDQPGRLLHPKVVAAYEAAASARFEHGESPIPGGPR